MYPQIKDILSLINLDSINLERKKTLQVLIDYIQLKKDGKSPILLNFICTHNSRRSQFCQIWAAVAATYYQIKISSFSGGTETSSFNPKAIKSLKCFGFEVDSELLNNPKLLVKYDKTKHQKKMFSKIYNHKVNPTIGFAAIMVCSHADKNCPIIDGCDQRISIPYNDPKVFDDSPLEDSMYNARSFEIASEMMYVFSKIK